MVKYEIYDMNILSDGTYWPYPTVSLSFGSSITLRIIMLLRLSFLLIKFIANLMPMLTPNCKLIIFFIIFIYLLELNIFI